MDFFLIQDILARLLLSHLDILFSGYSVLLWIPPSPHPSFLEWKSSRIQRMPALSLFLSIWKGVM